MLFTGVVVHMLGYSNLNIAITKMVKLRLDASNKTFVAHCSRLNTPNSTFEEIQETPVRMRELMIPTSYGLPQI